MKSKIIVKYMVQYNVGSQGFTIMSEFVFGLILLLFHYVAFY